MNNAVLTRLFRFGPALLESRRSRQGMEVTEFESTTPRLAFGLPARLITLIVPFAAGAAADVVGRLLAQRMRTGPRR